MALASSACAAQSMNATQEMNQCVSPVIMAKSAVRFLLQTSLLVSRVGDLSVFHNLHHD